MDALLAELTALETELHHPGAPCTRERLERLLHPDFHEVGRSGARYTRQVVIDFLATRGQVPRVIAEEHRVESLTADIALLHFRSHEVTADGSALHAALRMSVWRRTDVGWQLSYHQGTPAAL
ncbi:DUF4440 domain-containing protein [Pseudoxanthomonas sp. PXM01]|uniref:nuclear transport factor 2 family protein n=1 Tax=Pseudoxanthomonas sp. PXM01 TaxID=2769295 RepID=UPI00177FCB5E|nr:DUF4440 domain-containing protein [Pseudoxanthomonas sp. PXM01]MBD9470137.1 DUF4440 domain-containing protein [Pseudoxanthomonas sp. PXM01]